MRVCGFTFVRNGVLFDYPFIESIQSLLPLCDQVFVAVGDSDDDTMTRIQALADARIEIIPTTWDPSLRTQGLILSQQTNIALARADGDWAVYLQADEVLHEKDYDRIRAAMHENLPDARVEGLLFRYLHFYGSYGYVGNSRRWYRREIRVVRPGIGVRSWGDAQGFRIDNRKLRVRLVDADVYHYGWVKTPQAQQRKQRQFNRLWHSDDWVERNVPDSTEFDYSTGGRLRPFEGVHPSVMVRRIQRQNWTFSYDPHRVRQRPGEALLDWIERHTGWRPAEYRNYTLL